MDENRLKPFFARLPEPNLTGGPFAVVQSPTAPLQPIHPVDLYQAAFEKAKQEYQLNRLFNPEHYEDGGGI
ncbi:hypothetical protein NA78x_002355 [Anatilimnocola sp. NA78]|uniref:hypothetical protein n=1 Tax=Anatilimnocola sp. NA78 TaxID=3415683 RepID=UPI003CE4FAEB